MKTLLAFLLLCLAITTLAQIGAKTQQGKVTGIWQNSDFGYQMTLMLNADGTGEFDGESISYSTQGTTLAITQAGVTNRYTFTQEGNSLKLSGGDLDAPITFSRGGNGSAQVGVQQQAAQNQTDTGGAIVGAWSNYGETIEFKNNGQCIYLNQTFQYQLSGNHVVLQTSQGNIMMAYTVQGNNLTLTVNGKTFTYTKGKAGGAPAAVSQNGTGSGKLDMSLVGKWCYVNVTTTNTGGTSSDECIIIHENGTYEYHAERSMSTNTDAFWAGTSSQNSDRGTWWVESGRIFYNSQTQGQGSYQLVKQNHPKNGDPMIVLDGKTYVTFYQKSPW